jgi:hypothetical protein
MVSPHIRFWWVKKQEPQNLPVCLSQSHFHSMSNESFCLMTYECYSHFRKHLLSTIHLFNPKCSHFQNILWPFYMTPDFFPCLSSGIFHHLSLLWDAQVTSKLNVLFKRPHSLQNWGPNDMEVVSKLHAHVLLWSLCCLMRSHSSTFSMYCQTTILYSYHHSFIIKFSPKNWVTWKLNDQVNVELLFLPATFCIFTVCFNVIAPFLVLIYILSMHWNKSCFSSSKKQNQSQALGCKDSKALIIKSICLLDTVCKELMYVSSI